MFRIIYFRLVLFTSMFRTIYLHVSYYLSSYLVLSTPIKRDIDLYLIR